MKAVHILVGGEVSGGQIICGQMVQALRARGDETLIISPTRGAFTDRLVREGFPVRFLPFQKTYHVQNAFRLASLLKQEKADLVHTHGMVPVNVQARLGAYFAGVPVISHIHISNYFSANPLLRAYQRFLDQKTSRLCSRVIAVSKAVQEDLLKQGYSPKQISIVYNGVNFSSIRPARTREAVLSELSLPSNAYLIMTAGRLCDVKGQKELMRAAHETAGKISNAFFLIVGKDLEQNGFYEAGLKHLARELKMEKRALFTGYREDIYDLMNASDLFVLPSKAEGLPLTLLEAMALGKPVIASAVGGVPELVSDGETGRLIPPGDYSALAHAILECWKDQGRAKNMARMGQNRVKTHFSEAAMLNQTFEIYEEILGTHNLIAFKSAGQV